MLNEHFSELSVKLLFLVHRIPYPPPPSSPTPNSPTHPSPTSAAPPIPRPPPQAPTHPSIPAAISPCWSYCRTGVQMIGNWTFTCNGMHLHLWLCPRVRAEFLSFSFLLTTQHPKGGLGGGGPTPPTHPS